MNTLKLDIVTPEGRVFSKDVASVTLPGKEGEFGVLPGHSSLVALLGCGVIEIEKSDGERDSILINWGYAKVDENSVDVLVDGAVAIAGKDESELVRAIDEAKKLVSEISDSSIMIASVEAKVESIAKSAL
jgi:F-type H+-transporting ATPase subunit epsilon